MMKDRMIQSIVVAAPARSIHTSNRSRGVAIVLVIVAVAAAAVIGSAYVASLLNAPQIVGNVNEGIEARYLADSGADLATAIMECETIDWRAAQVNGVLVDSLPVGNGTVSITVKEAVGVNPDSVSEYPIIVSTGKSGAMRQIVGTQAFSPLPATLNGDVDVDLSEFAAFGNSSIYLASGWIARWPASPRAGLGLPVKVGTNATTSGALAIKDSAAAPDVVGYVMKVAPGGTISNTNGGPAPIGRQEFSNNETVMLPAPPTPNFSQLLWAGPTKTPNITFDLTAVSIDDRRYKSLTVDGATLTIDLAGGSRVVGISGNFSMNNAAVLKVQNGQLDLVVQGTLSMFNASTIELGSNATMRIFVGSNMFIDDSVLGLPVSVRDMPRDARTGLSTYYDPSLCTIYRLTSINSIDLNPLDFDDAATWVWSDNTIKSWIFTTKAFVCARLYGPTKMSASLDSGSAIFGNVVADSINIANGSAIYYDHALDSGSGYTNPASALYAAPLDLRDDVRPLLTSLNDSVIATVLALVATVPVPPSADPFAPTPRDKDRVSKRWWKHYGVKVKRDRESLVEAVIDDEHD